MKAKLFASVVAAAALGFSGAASAQTVTGTVNITGSVAGHCSMIPGGGSTFSRTFALGELAQADGTLRSISPQTTSGSGVRVSCSTVPAISISATPLRTNNPGEPPGYTNSISYTASAEFTEADDSVQSFTALSGAPANSGGLAGLLKNAPDNVVIRAYGFQTSSPTDILVADPNYSSVITVTVSPS